MTFKSFFIAVLASALCLSCSETNLDGTQITQTKEEPKILYTYDADIEATSGADKDTAQATRIPDMPFQIGENFVPKTKLTGDSVQSLIVLYDKANNKKQVLEAKWKIYKKGGKTYFRLQKLPVYNSLKTGEWYLMAFLGGGKKSGDNLQVTTNTTLEPMKNGNSFTASCPFATTWRRVVLKGSKLELNTPNTEMIFKPQGVFLVLNVENRMTLNTKLNRDVRMESNAFCSSGTYQFNITQGTMADNADFAFDYWSPDESKAITGNSAAYTKYNAKHYFTEFKLKYKANVNDGSDRTEKGDIEQFLYFNKKNKGANPQTAGSYVLCLMPVKYQDPSQYGARETQALFYGKVNVTESGRVNPTYKQETYLNESGKRPETWYPCMENRYLLGSFREDLSKGSKYNLTLRIVRPMLPIERLWTYNQETDQGKKWEQEPKDIVNGNTNGGRTVRDFLNKYPNFMSLKYRLPKYAELMPIFHNCKKQLETGDPIGKDPNKVYPYSIGDKYGWAISITTPGDYFALNGKQYKFDNWFCAEKGSKVLYGIMNMKPYQPRGGTDTYNYRYAVRMTFETPKEDQGVAIIEVYYLGPNYNLSARTMGYHVCHPDFWSKLNEKDIIKRSFRLGADYWLNYDETHQATEKRSKFNKFTLDAVVQDPNTNPGRWKDAFFLPWLKEPAW